MAKVKKEKKYGFKQASQDYWDMVGFKINEVKGMYMGADDASEAANAVANLYSKGG